MGAPERVLHVKGDVVLRQNTRAQRIVQIVVDVGDAVGKLQDLPLGCLGAAAAGVV